MSWTSPSVAQNDLLDWPSAFPCTARCETTSSLTSRLLEHEQASIWPEPKSSPTVFMPSRRWSLMMISGVYFWRACSRASMIPCFSPSMMWARSCSSIDCDFVSFFAVAVARSHRQRIDRRREGIEVRHPPLAGRPCHRRPRPAVVDQVSSTSTARRNRLFRGKSCSYARSRWSARPHAVRAGTRC